MRLTGGIVKNSEIKTTKYSLSDGNGLQLTIKPNGKKIWEIRYTFNGKSNTTTLGSYPVVTLKDARIKCEDFKRKLNYGTNPVLERRELKNKIITLQKNEEKRTKYTFDRVARDFIDSIANNYSPRYILVKLSRLENHVFPYIGKKSLDDITRSNLIECIDYLTEVGKIETAERILSTISDVYKYAVTRELASRNITFEIDKRYVIGKKEIQHFATITNPIKVGELLRVVDNYHGNFIIKCALKLAIYTAQRPYNIRFAEWDEFNLEKNEWNISANKMKMKRAHFVPLTKQIKHILEELIPYSQNKSKYLFPSLTSNLRPISENTLNQALRRLSYAKEEIVSHGLRAMFSTLANENMSEHGYHSDVIERHLAHVESNRVRSAYNHAEYYSQRCNLLEWYCNYLDALKENAIHVKRSAEVVSF